MTSAGATLSWECGWTSAGRAPVARAAGAQSAVEEACGAGRTRGRYWVGVDRAWHAEAEVWRRRARMSGRSMSATHLQRARAPRP
eukprot:3852143-Prymnesium_polylepis.1